MTPPFNPFLQVRLPAARELLASLEHSLRAEKAKFEEISEKQAKKQEEANELEEGGWYPGKILMGKKKNEEKVCPSFGSCLVLLFCTSCHPQVEKAQEAAEEVARKVAASAAVLEQLHARRAAQAQLVKELSAKVRRQFFIIVDCSRHLISLFFFQAAQLQQARQWEEMIVPQVFTGPVGDSRENTLEREVDALLPRLQHVRWFIE